MQFSKFFRVLALSLSCLWLAACTQTAATGSSAVSTYSGLIGDKTVSKSETERRKLKREAARARAAKRREAKKRAFESRRAERMANGRAERRSLSTKRRKKSTAAAKSAKAAPSNRQKSAATKARKAVKKSRRKSSGKKGRKNVAKAPAVKASYAAGAGARVATAGKPWSCVPGRLKAVLGQVARKYGRVTVNSTHRSRVYNRKIGGKRSSYHLKCQAVDFRVHGNTKGLLRYLARHKLVGGYKRYKSGFYHIDTGPKRTW